MFPGPEPLALLGLPPGSADDRVRYLREGLPVSAWDALKRLLRCSDRELGILTQIPPSTLARRRRAGRLNRLEGERLYRVAAVVAQALSTFGDPEAAVGSGSPTWRWGGGSRSSTPTPRPGRGRW